MEILYLSRRNVEDLGMTMNEVLEVVDNGFRLKGLGKTEMPPKPGIHPRQNCFIHAMPAYVQEVEAAGLKWVSGFPPNTEKNLPYITGLLILNDPDTGIPIAVMDCSWITAMRTGASVGISAKYLARKESKIAGILGCGVQARTSLVFSLESSNSRMFNLANQSLQQGEIRSTDQLLMEIDAVTCEQVKRVAGDWMEPSTIGLAVLGTKAGSEIRAQDLVA